MRLNPKFILRKVADETLLISVQDISAPKKLLMLNDLGSDIYAFLLQEKSIDEIHALLLDQYEVQPDILRSDIDEFLLTLKNLGVLID